MPHRASSASQGSNPLFADNPDELLGSTLSTPGGDGYRYDSPGRGRVSCPYHCTVLLPGRLEAIISMRIVWHGARRITFPPAHCCCKELEHAITCFPVTLKASCYLPNEAAAHGGHKSHALEAIQHQLRSLGQQYSSSTPPMQKLITTEKGVAIDFDSVSRGSLLFS